MRKLKRHTEEEMAFLFGENWREKKIEKGPTEVKEPIVKEKTPFAKLLEEKARQRYREQRA